MGPELGSLLWSDAPLQGCGEGREGEDRPQYFMLSHNTHTHTHTHHMNTVGPLYF